MRFYVHSFILLASLLTTVNAMAQTEPDMDNNVVAAKGRAVLGYWYAVDADCSPKDVKIQIVTPPKNGKITTVASKEFPDFDENDALAVCNKRRVNAITAVYTANAKYKGSDRAELKIIFPEAEDWPMRYVIQVK